MNKLIAMGECLIDFIPTQNGVSLDKVKSFERKAGGAPANVAACVAKLGGESHFLGKFSSDKFGVFLLDSLRKNNVKTDYAVVTDEAKTALAFVSLNSDGERDFSFYRNPSADMLLCESEIKQEWFSGGDILHFCSVDLIEAPVKYAHKKAIEFAIKNSAIVSFDVNVRLSLWNSENECAAAIKEFLAYPNILKVSEDELLFLTGIAEEKIAVKKILNIATRATLIFVTKGSRGVTVYDNLLNSVNVKSEKVKAVDATGAGDCFIGCIIYQILRGASADIDNATTLAEFANIGAGIAVTRYGAIEAMPTLYEIENLLKIKQI